MKLTKYEHACFTVEHDGQIIVVDPGNFTTDFIAPEGVVAVIVTHQHADHFDPDMLAAIYNKNPESLLLADQEVIRLMPDHRGRAVVAGERIEIESFSIQFFGAQHATIHPTIPIVDNLGVLINDLLYYPGDSFTLPSVPVDTLALPVAAPWLKLQESVEFLRAVAPRFVFPTHDAVLSDIGKSLIDRMITQLVADDTDIKYARIDGTIDI